MLVTMHRIEVVAPRSLAREAMRIIHRAGVVHLTTFEACEGTALGTFASGADDTAAERAPDLPSTRSQREQALALLLEDVTRLGSLLGPATPDRKRLEAARALADESLATAVGDPREGQGR